MFKRVIPVAAVTTLALGQMLFPSLAVAEGATVKTNSAASSQKIQEMVMAPSGNSPSFISGSLTAPSSGSPEAIVYSFLNSAKHTYQLESDAKDSFATLQSTKDDLGYDVVRLQQTYKGIPVFGSQQIAHIKKGVLDSFSGSVVPEGLMKQGVSADKKISPEQAIAAAQQDLNKNPKLTQNPTADLNIYMYEGKARLAYVVRLNFLSPDPGNWYYFIDAATGAVIHKFNSIDFDAKSNASTQANTSATGASNSINVDAKSDVNAQATASATGVGVLGDTKTLRTNKVKGIYYLQDYTRGLGIQTYDAAYTQDLPGKQWIDTDGKLNAQYDAPAVDAHYYAGVTYDFYKKTFNRNSFDDKGAIIKSSVHYDQGYNNAFWDGTQMVYGDGDGQVFRPLSGGLDVVGHELTHAVTERTAGLIYENESGAINESMSDVFGTLIEFYNNKNPDWAIGEDVYTPATPGDALRYMYDPTKEGDPDHYSQRYTGSDDNGGVHSNSGIGNKAAYLISEGGTSHGVKVKGIGRDKLGKIYYRALTQYLVPASNFQHLRYSLIQSATDLYGKNSAEVQTVNNAFAAVGVTGIAADSQITTLTLGQPTTFEIKNPGDVKWFKVDPKAALAQNSHITFTVSGDYDSYVSVYKDKDSADKGQTTPDYANQVNEVTFPLAWNGPVYVKVESTGIGVFTINNTPKYLQPTDPPQDCVSEVSLKGDTSAVGMLDSLRGIRDHLLNNTDKGKGIADLYYGISRDVVGDAIVDASFRGSIASDMKKLQPVISELQNVSNGKSSSYKLTTEDVATMKHLKDTVEKKASKEHVKQLDALWNELHLTGQNVSTVVKGMGLTETPSQKILMKVKKGVSAGQLSSYVKKSMTSLGIKDSAAVHTLSNSVVKAEDSYTLEVKNSPEKLVAALKKLDIFEYVELNKTMHAFSTDVQYPAQWSLENTGQTTGDNGNAGTAGADIKFAPMQKFLAGKPLPDTMIAVVDTGVNYTLGDFAGKVRTDIDYDFVNNDNDAMDDGDHGTHVAGIIGATADDNLSMAGINQHTKILPVKVLDSEGSGSWENVALGIRYAADKGAKVINLSLGGSEASATVEDALKYAVSKGVTVVAAAGNDSASKLSYPASSDYVISVGATDNSDQLASYSNQGEGLDVVAPGDRIPSFYDNGQIYYQSGTSMAAPHVAAVAGLLYSIKPSIQMNDVLQVLQDTSVDLGQPGYDTAYGWGRLDAYEAVKAISGQDKQAPSAPQVNPVSDKDTFVTGKAEANSAVVIKNGNTQVGKGTATIKGDFKIQIPLQKAGVTLSVTAMDAAGNVSKPTTVKVLDKTAPAAPTVNKVGSTDKYVTGKAEAGSAVKITVSGKQVGAGSATAGGDFKVAIPVQKTGVVLSVTATDAAGNPSASKTATVTTADQAAPSVPTVNPVKSTDKAVIGKAEASSTVKVTAAGKQIGTSDATGQGDFNVQIPVQKAGTVVSVMSVDAAGNVSKAATITVQTLDKIAPGVPTVNAVTTADQYVTGKAEANSTVKIMAGGKQIGTGTASAQGDFKIQISLQKAGTVLTVTATDATGNQSAAASVTVVVKK